MFAGNPPLIQGFNTFLPPGYRIECGTGDDPNAIRVTTPMGNTVLAMPAPYRALSRGPDGDRNGNGARTPQPGQTMYSPSGRPVGPATVSAQVAQAHADARDGAHTLHDSARGAFTNDNLAKQSGASPVPGRTTPLPLGEGGLDGQGGDMTDDKKEPVEFNHAINYVNKIKNRFATQPEIYKSFLDILQTYQRESRPIQEVYGQVTKLFESATDLLEDFKQFLPETTSRSKASSHSKRKAAEEAIMTSNVRGESAKTAQLQKTPHAEHRLPPVGNFAPTPTVNKDHKRKRGDTNRGMGGGVAMVDALTEQGKGVAGASGSVAKKAKHGSGMQRVDDGAVVSPTLVPARPQPMAPTSKTAATSDELSFFDRVKKTIGNKNTMNEFLKLCNLYTQDLIDKTTLVHRSRAFIGGNPELFKWFTTWVGYEDTDAIVIENRARHPSGRVMLSNCRGLGPSYRLLPKRERQKPCSGRDELCHSVLNDDWASHPTWASEDSGFIAHRKNTYEEGLHKIEEERHDYDFHIEACGRTIQLLEPFAQQLLRMPEKDREAVEIPPGIGGQSETIHKRIIMKIYGRLEGQEVIEALHSRPFAVIPVVLNRLKQKHEEWKNAQREWEKVWREQTAKIFWKSLDHQAVNAKQADKRQFQTKTLLGEIQTKYEEQKKQRVQGASVAQVTKPQMAFHIEDMDVVADACCLVLTYAEQFHSTEAPRFSSFVRDFIPLFCGIDGEWFNHQIKLKLGEESGDEIMSDYDGSLGPRRRAAGKKDDLRRGVLDRANKGGRNDGSGTPLSRASTPDHASRADEDMSEAAEGSAEDAADATTDTWADYPAGLNKYRNKEVNLNEPYRRNDFNLYGNTSIYCFIRMFVILYERLSKLKESEPEVQDAVRRAMMTKPAIDLGLIDKQPQNFFGDVSPSANYYRQVLSMFDDFIRNNDMDIAHIEETLRRYYLQCGWQLYSVDKLLSALVRFVLGIIASDSRDKSWEILQAFKKDRVKDETTYQDEMNYRKTVERFIKDGDTYKINYVSIGAQKDENGQADIRQDQDKSVISMKVFKRDEPTFETSTMIAEDVWRVYVNDFLSSAPTHGTPMDMIALPVLKRNIKQMESDSAGVNDEEGEANIGRRFDLVRAKEQLEFKITVGDLKLAFTPDNDEYWHQPYNARVGGRKGIEEVEESVRYREEKVDEKYRMNNAGMKGLSKEDVEGKNEEFRKVCEGEGAAGTSGGDAMDEN